MPEERAKKTKSYLTDWAKIVHAKLNPQGIYVLGSLVYCGGAQFNDKSDIDILIVMPEVHDGVERADWLEALLEHKINLEDELGKLLSRADRNAVISSISVATVTEIAANIHKDGAAEFYSSNQFLDLSTGNIQHGLPGAGERLVGDRLVGECLRHVQKTRNDFLRVNSLGIYTLQPFDDKDDAAPKQTMRHAAMIQFLRDSDDTNPGEEFDLDIGADTLTVLLNERRKRLGSLCALYSARRGGRAARRPISSKDQLVLAELIFDAAIQIDSPAAASETVPRIPTLGDKHSTVFFAERFSSAYPGTRGISWFEDDDMIRQQLALLLEQPLKFVESTPIGWTRGRSNLPISDYKETPDFLLINFEEMKIVRVAAVSGANYKYNFVYVEVDPLPPIGIYKQTPQEIVNVANGNSLFSYYWEEYGLVDGIHLVNRAEADDGSAIIDGKIQPLRGRLEIRSRYVTKYNFIIAASDAPIMDSSYDYTLEEHLNAMLKGENRLKTIVDESLRLSAGYY